MHQIDAHCKRLLWIGQHRSAEAIKAFFTWLTPERAVALSYICSDMWKPYLKVVAKRASSAIHVLDRFHIMSRFSKAIDEVRADEARKYYISPVRNESNQRFLRDFRINRDVAD